MSNPQSKKYPRGHRFVEMSKMFQSSLPKRLQSCIEWKERERPQITPLSPKMKTKSYNTFTFWNVEPCEPLVIAQTK